MADQQILIIEDEPDLRQTFKDLLELEGFEAATAGNGREALEFLQKQNKPCLILLDLMMPVMNGWEFLETVKTRHQQVFDSVPIVIISAAADVADAQLQYGCSVMQKPVDIQRLFKLAHGLCDPC